MVALERVRLPPRAIEREHQLAAQSFTQREPPDERLQLGDQVAGAAQVEVRVDAPFDRVEAHFLEAADLGLRECLEGKVGEWLAAPQLERPAEQRGAFLGRRLERLGTQLFEPRQVERARIDPEHVAGRLRLDYL